MRKLLLAIAAVLWVGSALAQQEVVVTQPPGCPVNASPCTATPGNAGAVSQALSIKLYDYWNNGDGTLGFGPTSPGNLLYINSNGHVSVGRANTADQSGSNFEVFAPTGTAQLILRPSGVSPLDISETTGGAAAITNIGNSTLSFGTNNSTRWTVGPTGGLFPPGGADTGVGTINLVPNGTAQGLYVNGFSILPWAVQVHESGGGVGFAHGVLWSDANNVEYGDRFTVYSYDTSLLTSYSLAGTYTTADKFGFTWVVNNVSFNPFYTVQAGDTQANVCAGVVAAVLADTALLNALLALHDGGPAAAGNAPDIGCLGNGVIAFDQPFATSGNSVVPYVVSSTGTFTQAQNSGNVLDNAPGDARSRNVPGRTPSSKDEIYRLNISGQSGPNTGPTTIYGAITVEITAPEYVTSAATSSGAVLQFAADPVNAVAGQLVSDVANMNAIPAGTTVLSVNHGAFTVTLSGNVGGPGVASGDYISFLNGSSPSGVMLLGTSSGTSNKSNLNVLFLQSGIYGAATDGSGLAIAGGDPGPGLMNMGGYQIAGVPNGTAFTKNASGSGPTVASVTGSFTTNDAACIADTSGTVKDCGSAPSNTGAWTTFSPTITCSTSGSVTTDTASGRYLVNGKTETAQVSINITVLGTCLGNLQVAVPSGLVNSTGVVYMGSGMNTTGPLNVPFYASSAAANLVFGFATAPAANQYYGEVTFELN